MSLSSSRLPLLLIAALCAPMCCAQPLVANVRQGTNISLALSPDGQKIVIDLLGQLWEMPAAGGGATPLTPADRVVRNPRYSPDGSRIVYQLASNNQWDIWLLELESGASRQLTGEPYNEKDPDFSRDGRSVVFASDRAGSFDIWELGFDFGRLRQLSRTPGDASFPTVSELGSLVFANESADGWSIEILEASGLGRTVYRSDRPLRAPSWRPGGGVLVFAEQLGVSESELRMLVMSPDPVVKTLISGEDLFGFRPAWLSPAEYLYTADGGIWRRSIASIERTPVMFFAGVGVGRADHALRITSHAPSGENAVTGIRAAATTSTGDARAFTAIGDLWLQTASGDTTRLTDDPYLEIDPAFGPGGNFVVYASDRAGNMDLWRMSLAGGGTDRISTEPGKAFRPSVSPDGGQVAYLVTRGFGAWDASELFVKSLASGAQPRPMASGLIPAGRPEWIDNNEIQLAALRNDGSTTRPELLRIDVMTGADVWTTLPAGDDRAPDSSGDGFPAPSISWLPRASAHRYVLQVDRLFDGVGTDYRRNMDIHVQDGRIVDVVPRGRAPLPETVIDARSFTVIPGLIDMHAHQSALGGERLGRIWLAFGVTTVREVDSDMSDALERREAWASGRRRGPRLLFTGPAVSDSTTLASDVVELDADLLPEEPAMAAAKALGIPIFSNRLLPAARLGINGLEHIGGRTIQPLGLERSPLGRSYQDVTAMLTTTMAAVAPTLSAFGGFARLAAADALWADALETSLFEANERDSWLAAGDGGIGLSSLQQTVADLVRAGSRVTAGSDAPTAPYGLGLHAELKLMTEAGLANDQVLRLATANAALALGLERELGTIEPGKLADFIVLSGDPLTRIEDTLRIEATVLGGEWLTRESLLSAP